MVERVDKILKAEFPGMELDLETMSSGRITGDVIWSGFKALDHIDRLQLIRDVLRRDLGDESREVSILLTFTPEELRSMQEV
jgi:hypothetical protein